MTELTEYMSNRTNIPNDDDQPFVAAYEYDAPNLEKRWFRSFITTKRLIQLATKSKYSHCGLIYKMGNKYFLLFLGCLVNIR